MNATATDAVRAYAVVTRVFDLPSLWAEIDALDNVVHTDVADEMVLETRRLLDRAARWFLTNRPQPLAVGAEIARFAPAVTALRDSVPGMLVGREAEALAAEEPDLAGRGVPSWPSGPTRSATSGRWPRCTSGCPITWGWTSG